MASGLITVREFDEVSYTIGARVNRNLKGEDLLFFDKAGSRLR
jgi:hypothetical protein